jgi:hypothetical protein
MKEETKQKLQVTVFMVICFLAFPGVVVWFPGDSGIRWDWAWQLAVVCALFIYCTIWDRGRGR